MKERFREVVDLLRTEAAICRDLLRAMAHERVAMLRSRLDPLGALAAEKEALIQRMQTAERQRQEWVGQLAGQLGCPAAELTLSRLALKAPPAFAETLSNCRIELSELLERLRTENRRSAMLSHDTAELLRSFYGVIKDWAVNGPVYQPGGRMQAARLNGKIFSHEM
jgi:flagellar biosynthesis/type III secretory pathway chaperone